ncbi:TRPT1, partial [Symbiodinium necroappetens]
MDGTTVATQYYQRYKRDNDKEVRRTTARGLGSLLDLEGDINCDEGNVAPGLVLSKISFSQGLIVGNCVVGAVDADSKTAPKTVDLSFQIQNSLYKKCLVIGPCGAGADIAVPCIQSGLQACDGGPAQSFVRGPLVESDVNGYREMYKLRNGGKNVELAFQSTEWSTVAWQLPDSGLYENRFGIKEERVGSSVQANWVSLQATSGGGDIRGSRESFPYFNSKPANSGDAFVWTMSTTLSDTEFELDCGAGFVIQQFLKLQTQVRYSCVRLASLGACAEQTSVQQIIGNTAARIDMDCGSDRSIQAIFGEYDAAGKWARFRFRCCQIAANPILFRRTSDEWEDSELTEGELGIYAPVGIDDFGRPQFDMELSFCKSCGFRTDYKFKHNADEGEWCVSRRRAASTCVSSDLVHPLDEQLGGNSWQAVPVDSFDASSQGGGGARLPRRYTAKRAPPQLRFESEDPQFAPECKDESTPGTSTFSQEEMNQVAEELTTSNPDNPCANIFSTPKTKKQSTGTEFLDKTIAGLQARPDVSTFFPQENDIEEEGEGSSWYEWNLKDVDQPGESGITYKNTKGCDDRQGERDKVVEAWEEEHERRAAYSTLVAENLIPWLEANPRVQVSFFGNGFEIPVGEILTIPVK